METFLAPSSIGEALDRLTILQLKLEYINDERRDDVQREYDDLFLLVKDKIDLDEFHYKKLFEVNRIMWNIQTQLHNDASIIDKDQEYTLMKELALQNQRRFRIKRTINYNLGSKHAEQKGYKGKRIFILSHLDVDNQLCINGGIRYLATLFDEVCLVVKRDTEVRLKQLYKNEPAITFYNVNNETDISPRFGCAINIFETITKSYDKVLLCGLHKHDTLLNSLNIVLHEDINVSPSLSSNWSLIA